MIAIEGVDGLKARAGEEVGVSEWREITQEQVDAFADATGDHQWIHVDPKRARASPFGGTIVHGYFTLSLHIGLVQSILTVTGFAMELNYGLNRVRFVSPLPVGDKVRLRVGIAAVQETEVGAQTTWTLTWERQGSEKPVCIAESLTRYNT